MCSLFYMNLVEISVLCLCFSSPTYAGLPNLDFIVMNTFCIWNHFYRDHFKHMNTHQCYFALKAFPPLSPPASERYLGIFLVSVSWVLEYAQKHLTLPRISEIAENGLIKVKAWRTLFMWDFLTISNKFI